MLKKLLVLSFVEGAVVMAAELCGAKLLAPIFGSSLYVWASVMGITLAALALGYFAGGWLSAQNKNAATRLFWVLNSAALFVALMPVLSYYAVPRISYLPFLPAVVASTLLLLFPPVFFLGATSPLLIHLQSAAGSEGKVSGTVYAVSTLGGICATFLCGFYLIPLIGLTFCLLGFGTALLVTNLVVLKCFKPLQLMLFIAVVYLNLQFSLKKSGQLFASDSLLGHLEVEEFTTAGQGPVRVLKINSIIQTEMSLASQQSVSDYVLLLDTLIPPAAKSDQALVLGLGGGLVANELVKKNYQVDGVELDERIITAARHYFYLDSRVHTYCEDARYFLNHCHKRYAVVLMDIFKAEEQPSHVLTLESLEQLKANLAGPGLVLVNWHGYLQGKRGLGTSIVYATFLRAGFKVKVCSTSANEDYRNLVFVASLQEPGPLPLQLALQPASTKLVNTDELPLLEKYNAEANKAWRTNYLRYYQQR